MRFHFLTSRPRTYTQRTSTIHTGSFCHIILLNILWNCCSNTYHCGLKLFYDLQTYTELYEINWTLFLSHCAQVFVSSHGVLTLHVTTGRTFWNRCGINDLIIVYMWHDKRNCVSNGGFKYLWSGYEMLVAKGEGKLLVDSRI